MAPVAEAVERRVFLSGDIYSYVTGSTDPVTHAPLSATLYKIDGNTGAMTAALTGLPNPNSYSQLVSIAITPQGELVLCHTMILG